MTVLEFMYATFSNTRHSVRPRAECADGFSVSIQGGTEYHYCEPRELCNKYEEVELGYPSEREESLIPYMDGGEGTDPTETVYGWVPIETVEAVVQKHGGILPSSCGRKTKGK